MSLGIQYHRLKIIAMLSLVLSIFAHLKPSFIMFTPWLFASLYLASCKLFITNLLCIYSRAHAHGQLCGWGEGIYLFVHRRPGKGRRRPGVVLFSPRHVHAILPYMGVPGDRGPRLMRTLGYIPRAHSYAVTLHSVEYHRVREGPVAMGKSHIQYIPRNMHTVSLCFALLWLCNRS